MSESFHKKLMIVVMNILPLYNNMVLHILPFLQFVYDSIISRMRMQSIPGRLSLCGLESRLIMHGMHSVKSS